MPGDARSRLDYLVDMVGLLWPKTATPCGSAPMVVLPSVRRPRVLVPVRPRRAPAAAIMRYTAQQGMRDRLASTAIAVAARAGATALLPPVTTPATDPQAESITDHLARVMGGPVHASLALTVPRPNRKPVLQVFDAAGRTIAFAKVGIDPLTKSLVGAEARALRQLSTHALRDVTVPRLIDHSPWGRTEVLVTTALPSGRRVRRRGAALDRAMREIAAASEPGPSGANDYLIATRGMAQTGGESDQAERFEQWHGVFDLVAERCPVADVQLGAWHGDWTEWNCATHRGAVAVWDWERFAVGVPCGFDKLHFAMSDRVGPRRDRFLPAAMELIDAAPELLVPWHLQKEAARSTAMLYILQLALRYLLDAVPPRSVGSRIEQWAYPAVRSALAGTS